MTQGYGFTDTRAGWAIAAQVEKLTEGLDAAKKENERIAQEHALVVTERQLASAAVVQLQDNLSSLEDEVRLLGSFPTLQAVHTL